jgi:hypothetical protein
MATTKIEVSGRRKSAAEKQRQKTLLPDAQKFTTLLKPEEVVLARSLARVIAQPGQALTIQDVLRIGLANLGLANLKKLEIGTEKQ